MAVRNPSHITYDGVSAAAAMMACDRQTAARATRTNWGPCANLPQVGDSDKTRWASVSSFVRCTVFFLADAFAVCAVGTGTDGKVGGKGLREAGREAGAWLRYSLIVCSARKAKL